MNITLKAIPTPLHKRLVELAKRNGRSLNAEVTAILEKYCMATPANTLDLLEKIRITRESLHNSYSASEISSARKEGRA